MYEINDEKQNESNSSYGRPPLPHDLTAEWTVRAQLTFARAGEPVRREFNINDPVNPVRVVYKWTNLDNSAGENETQQQNKSSRQSTPLKPTNCCGRSQSFRSNASSSGQQLGGGNSADYATDSALGGSYNAGSKRPLHQTANNGNGNTATAAFYGTRCQSTCNIVVSAVADFLPMEATGTDYLITEEDAEPYTFSTTASYSVLPQKSFDEYSSPATPKRGNYGRVLALVDAMCQTSDTETKYFEEQRQKRSRSPKHQQQRNYYEQRRATADNLLHSSKRSNGGEGNSSLPSYASSPGQTMKSASMSRIPNLNDFLPFGGQILSKTGGDAQKKPRTVHIDVYCTGSEEDEHADGETSSSASENEKHYEMDSNSTPLTVLDNEDMRLRHKRVTDNTVPRRWAQAHNVDQRKKIAAPADMHLGHAITKSSTAEEVSESKQLLFRKHIGDQRAAKLQNLKQKYTRQASTEDVPSSSYANSSGSTMRDATNSSICSFVQGDVVDAPWKEVEKEPAVQLTKSDSFDYDNSLDRVRIKRMERFWSRSVSSGFTSSVDDAQDLGSPTKFQHVQPHKSLQTISEGNSQRGSPYSSTFPRTDTLSESEHYPEHESTDSPINVQRQLPSDSPLDSSPTEPSQYFQQTPHFLRNRPGYLQFFGPANAPNQSSFAPVQNNKLQPTYPLATAARSRWKSETRELNANDTAAIPQKQVLHRQRCTSEAPTMVGTKSVCPASPMTARRWELHRDSPASVRSEASVVPPGYTPEYLELAKKFGKVVAVRKPGHHVGPTKNPNCSCESCQRWLAERFQIRGRAFSLGECPILKRPTRTN